MRVWRNVMREPSPAAATFWRASSSDSSHGSMPTTVESGKARQNATARAPTPVPMSRMRASCRPIPAPAIS